MKINNDILKKHENQFLEKVPYLVKKEIVCTINNNYNYIFSNNMLKEFIHINLFFKFERDFIINYSSIRQYVQREINNYIRSLKLKKT